jgi:hypothetical protein
MFVTGTNLEQAQAAQWFWSRDELVYKSEPTVGFESWAPPVPFGVIHVLFDGSVHWKSVWNGLGDMLALAFLYLLRSSIHASALKKNITNLVRKEPIPTSDEGGDENKSTVDGSHGAVGSLAGRLSTNIRMPSTTEGARNSAMPLSPLAQFSRLKHQRQISEVMDIEIPNDLNSSMQQQPAFKEIRAKQTRRSLENVFIEYGYALFVVAFTGGFAVCPTVATSNTMFAVRASSLARVCFCWDALARVCFCWDVVLHSSFLIVALYFRAVKIGAEGAAPQYGSTLLLGIFYLTDFKLVRFIPKAAFSSLLVLGAVDTFSV